MSFLVPGAARRMLICAVLALSLLALSVASASAATLDLEHLDGAEAVEMMESGELTSVELTQAYIARIEALNQQGPGLNAVSQFNKAALKEAQKTDELRAEDKILSPAMGLPILLKDIIDATGMVTSAGNWSLRDSYPEIDSGVAKKLREHGVVILGKLNLSEFANVFGANPTGFSNLNGQVLNVLDADESPSGSSSGNGPAAGAALSMLSIGTDTGGSIIGPSISQSLVGLRPTVGLVPGYGIAPIAASQDTAGPIARTVADAALTLTTIAGPDPLDDHTGLWGPGVDEDLIIPPLPNPIPDYLSALDPKFVEGKRIGYTNTSPETLEAKQALEDAGAILVHRPVISASVAEPPGVFPYEVRRDVTRYYERLGPNAPIKSLQEEVADNEANPHEALKSGNKAHHDASLIDISPDSPASVQYRSNLQQGKIVTREPIDRMLENDTPADPSDDFIAILDSLAGSFVYPPRAGYPWLTIPMGYTAAQRRTISVQLVGPAYGERDLLGIGYVLEQGTMKRRTPSELNPSMYRCSKTVPAPPYAERGSCNPDYDSMVALVGEVPDLPFALEAESVDGLQDRMSAGTLTALDLTKAYLARIGVANSAGPAIQAVREVNDEALAQAAALDAERAKSGPRGPLHGIPVLLDDGIDATGLHSTGGSIALQGATPGQSSRLVAKLKSAGAIVLGKANVSELSGLFSADMPEGYSSLGGQVLLPADTDKTVAGSSAGSATATAAGMAAMAVGVETSTDSAQLIAPAAVAGVVGLKPTVGRVSRAGVMPVAKSQDSPGPIARTVEDVATALQVIAGADFADPATTGTPPAPDYLAALSPGALSGKRVAVITSSAATYPEAVTKLGELGAVTVTKTIGAAAPNPIVTREFERDLNAYLGGLSGTTTNSLAEIVAYNEDNRVEGLKYRQGELTAAAGVDLNDLTQKAAYEADLATGKAADKATIDAILNNGTGGDPSDDLDLIAVPQGNALVGIADRAGYPVLTVPAGYGTGTAGRDPIGIVFVAAAFDEAELLADGYAFEQGTDVRELGPDYNPTSPGIQPLDGGSGSPSYTNPSMWRCVQLSEFYLPHHCRPGTVEPLTMVAPTNVPPTPPAPPAGAPKLRIKVAPKARTVGPDRKTAGFRLIVKNVGDATSGEVRLCASAPAKRLKVLGKKCIVVEIAAGASRERSVTAKIKPAAVGALTKITFTARGIVVGEMQTKAQLTVKEG